MKLVGAQINHFKSILNTSFTLQPDVTCLVGKNESGKTSVLHAIHRFNPAQKQANFNSQRQYPAWLEKKHRREKNLDEHVPVTLEFKIADAEKNEVEKRFGKGILKSDTIKIGRSYKNEYVCYLEYNEDAAVNKILTGIELGKITYPTSLTELEKLIEKLNSETNESLEINKKNLSLANFIDENKNNLLSDFDNLDDALWDVIEDYIPAFFYFDDYSQLPGSFEVKRIFETPAENLKSSEATAKSLLELGGAENDYLLNLDYETRKRELENIANAITHEVLDYWSTNSQLRTEIDITLKQVSTPQGQLKQIDELMIRLYDNRHLLSLPFAERSTGFRWFFSFLAAFSSYENSKKPIIILLDEPGLGLHAKAQSDFLKFIDERLSKKCQVIYSTHSPFMVQPGKLERIRLVQDDGRETGSRVTEDILSLDRDTLFPLQGALGYDMVQHLFIAPNNLVVEGTSDFTFLHLISSYLIKINREGLDPKWSIIPVGGADLIPSFIALLGVHLDVTVLVDSRKEGHQKIQSLQDAGILKETRLIKIGDIIESSMADIEDLFEINDYLILFNSAFSKSYKETDVIGKDPIVRRLARLLGVSRYDHGQPATALLKNYAEIIPKFSASTLDNFEKLFKKINTTLKQD